ncbi:hypothetical protein K432DRAFT_377158 [Lepidopterella palustris CBS 459.81]|uniref:Inclusion body clearance protein IML2 n=1 Tax=Lepidopterella palustris CBS 459.81 TaxID=1314670 RepID=A0A8E2EKZ0_9PEZI|nr:hypothetical protein K432DRAFT_377158 [Lepidopterella palustris CBS 459.81]
MLRMGGWLGGSKSKGSAQSLNALEEPSQIDDAMAAVALIMNDDIDGAEAGLDQGNSSFHKLGKGVISFMRATLGFEPEVMREASETLADAEATAYEHQRRAHRAPHAYHSPIYPPGTEYAVCLAESQLMGAVVAVLNESLTESIRGFYKLRKAYLTLEAVMEAERKYTRERSTSSFNSSTGSSADSATSARPSRKTDYGFTDTHKLKASQTPSSITTSSTSLHSAHGKENIVNEDIPSVADGTYDLSDADQDYKAAHTPTEHNRHLEIETEEGQTIELDTSGGAPESKSSSAAHSKSGLEEDLNQLTLQNTIKDDEDISVFGDHPVDLFILSGSNFCFGILLLIISLVPPAFATLLKIVGFKGDRERGIQMLWQATKFDNIHGAMAGLVLFGFYNGMTSFCDIIPQNGEGSHPKARCKKLLGDMRERYPKSHLWLIEEARLHAGEKQLEKAVSFMADCSESPLKQLQALQWFERSLNTMYLHEFAATSTAFQMCVTLNNWSHGLYYFICGAAHVELYRDHKTSNPEEAKVHADKATEFFKMVPQKTGRKRFMARQLPFDVFTNRKVQKWEARATEWKCDFIDAIGVSPLEEMIYFWNGYKRMRPNHLETSLQRLAWIESEENNPHWAKESLDEHAVLALLRAATYRNLGKTEDAKTLLEKEILSHDRAQFKGHLKENWTAPCARYEMAANIWREIDGEGTPEVHPDGLKECSKWLEEVASWESYDLDARIGMKVNTARSTMRRYGFGAP